MSSKPITIVGGGLAGLTLGIGLRQKGIPVIVWEAGHYPRHKACGEFISGRGQEVLSRFGLLKPFQEAGAHEASSATFAFGKIQGPRRRISPPALCLSRFAMDALLAKQFRASGGELLESQRWEGPCCEGVVRASGRRAHARQQGWAWFGLKVHARDVRLEADLELHGLRNGYVGLCRLPEGVTNICGLFRRRISSGGGSCAAGWGRLLGGAPDSLLHQRLGAAVLDETSFCSVAGLGLEPKRAATQTECRIGDALTMVPPVTGNGMSMAFEAAELAVGPLVAYSHGTLTWRQAQETIANACDDRFAVRLTWAAWLHKLIFAPGMAGLLGAMTLDSGWLWRAFFKRTR